MSVSHKHTPGPWVATFEHPLNACAKVKLRKWPHNEIATIWAEGEEALADQDARGIWPDQPRRNANARLIAAAPDMLEALVMAKNRLEDMLCGDDGQAWKEAEKAMSKIVDTIAKATGE